jgi:hypothetical protein
VPQPVKVSGSSPSNGLGVPSDGSVIVIDVVGSPSFVAPRVTVVGDPALTTAGSNDLVGVTALFGGVMTYVSLASVGVDSSSPWTTFDDVVFVSVRGSVSSVTASVCSTSNGIDAVAPIAMSPSNSTVKPSTSQSAGGSGRVSAVVLVSVDVDPSAQVNVTSADVAPSGQLTAPQPVKPR